MYSDSDLRFPKTRRPFSEARIAHVSPLIDGRGRFSGEHRVAAVIGSKEVDVRYVETSGEFQVIADHDVRALSRTDLRDLAAALQRYQQMVPWDDGEAGRVLVGLNDAIFPSCLATFTLRTVSDLGEVILVAGKADSLDVDVVLNAATGSLTVMVSKEGKRSRKRAPSSQEAHDLIHALRPLVEGRPLTRKSVLLALVLEAARRCATH
jgi:hypothetical protein